LEELAAWGVGQGWTFDLQSNREGVIDLVVEV
jgi:hypothetical protein